MGYQRVMGVGVKAGVKPRLDATLSIKVENVETERSSYDLANVKESFDGDGVQLRSTGTHILEYRYYTV